MCSPHFGLFLEIRNLGTVARRKYLLFNHTHIVRYLLIIFRFMSIISLLVGQCGNQVGLEFFKTIYSDCSNHWVERNIPFNDDFTLESVETFFNIIDGAKPEARCIQIDMEEKVVYQIETDANRLYSWRYPKNAFCAKRGSGNLFIIPGCYL